MKGGGLGNAGRMPHWDKPQKKNSRTRRTSVDGPAINVNKSDSVGGRIHAIINIPFNQIVAKLVLNSNVKAPPRDANY